MEEGSGYGASDGIYRSLRPPIELPSDPHLDLFSFLMHNSQHTAPFNAAHTALVDASTGRALTYSQLHQSVRAVASGLASMGVDVGNVVLILSPNSIPFAVLFLAVTSIGGIVTTVNPLNTSHEISKQIKDSAASLIFTVAALQEKVQNAGIRVILMEDGSPRKRTAGICYSDLLAADPNHAPKRKIRQSDTAALLYSSGTTGVSKGVVLSHRNFMAAALQLFLDANLQGIQKETVLCMLPMFHVYGLSGILYAQLFKGGTVVILPKFDLHLMLEAIQNYRVSLLPAVPPICIALAKQKAVEKYDLSSLKEIVSGAAPLGKEIMEECCSKLPNVKLSQGYGLTESTGIAFLLRGQVNQQFGSAGALISSMEAKIVDIQSGRPLPPTKQGELWLRGSNIMHGYLNNIEETRSTLDTEGWLHTGDLGYINENGLLFVVDRLKELIKYKGFQVAPAELEAVLLSNPSILDAAVVPLRDDEAGEVPHAFVVKSPTKSLSESEIMRFVADKVAPFKKLRKVTFVTSIPKSASGKILRRQLITQQASKL